ncbi:MAG: O-antigen ligase family protein [Candidatus Edwardsbacteria bacterium]|nr:O-antigen ligase family protein [Candidatus Edwardsbacteria bacterium]
MTKYFYNIGHAAIFALVLAIPFQGYLKGFVGISLTMAEVLANLAVLFMFLANIKRLNTWPRYTPFNLIIILYLLARAISFFITPEPDLTLSDYLVVISSLMFFLAGLYAADNYEQALKLIKLLLYVSVVSTLLGLVQVIMGASWISALISSKIGGFIYGDYAQYASKMGGWYWQPVAAMGLARAIGPFFYANPYCVYLGMVSSFAVTLVLVEKEKNKWLWVVILALALTNIILSQSRAGLMAISIIVLFLVFMFFGRAKKTQVFYTIVIGVIMITFVLAVLPYGTKSHIVEFTKTPIQEFSRWSIYQAYFAKVIENIWFGQGYNYSLLVRGYTQGPTAIHAHNLFLQEAWSYGIYPVIILILLNVVWLRVMIKAYLKQKDKNKRIMTLGCVIALSWFIFQSFFDYTFNYGQLRELYWFLLGLSINVIKDA